jgi:tryptophan 2,3-dioxygenase
MPKGKDARDDTALKTGQSVVQENLRPLDSGLHLDFSERLSYAGYLSLERLLSAQNPRCEPANHDEMLFIVAHQTSELWMKLAIHELRAAIANFKADRVDASLKVLARVKHIQKQLFETWAVLETLTPSEYHGFRHALGPASGFQSEQYRTIEFLLGNKNSDTIKVFLHDAEKFARLDTALRAPSLYDEFLAYLARHGHAIPDSCLQRDFSLPHTRKAELVEVFKQIYQAPQKYWDAYHCCEQLVDVEVSFQLWRFRHMKTVERIIGYKRGTGGSAGVAFLKQALDLTFFPELFEVRTQIGV